MCFKITIIGTPVIAFIVTRAHFLMNKPLRDVKKNNKKKSLLTLSLISAAGKLCHFLAGKKRSHPAFSPGPPDSRAPENDNQRILSLNYLPVFENARVFLLPRLICFAAAGTCGIRLREQLCIQSLRVHKIMASCCEPAAHFMEVMQTGRHPRQEINK